MFKKALATLVLLIISVTVSAADNPLSVHVLNTQNGLPGPGIEVTLAYYDDGQWVSLNAGKTNEQGRITALYPAGKKIKEGVYYSGFQFPLGFPRNSKFGDEKIAQIEGGVY